MSGKVAVVGLDGVPWWLLRLWMEAGLMSSLGGFVGGPLQSVLPPISPAAWGAFATSQLPAEHGVFDFLDPVSSQPIDFRWLCAKSFWELFAEQGHGVVVANYPLSYPASVAAGRLNNVDLVSGWIGAPNAATDVFWPPELGRELVGLLDPEHAWEPNNQAPRIPEPYVEESKALLRRRLKLFLYLLRTRNPDLFVGVFFDTDRVLHTTMALLAQNPFHPLVRGWVEVLDEVVGELLAELYRGGYRLVIVSDHGMQPCRDILDLQAWLIQQGLIEVRSRPASHVRYQLAAKLGWTGTTGRAILDRFLRLGPPLSWVALTLDRDDNLRRRFKDLFFLTEHDTRSDLRPLGYGLLHCSDADRLALVRHAVSLCPELAGLEQIGDNLYMVVPGRQGLMVVGGGRCSPQEPIQETTDTPGIHSMDGIFFASDLDGRPQPETLLEASGLVFTLLGLEGPEPVVPATEPLVAASSPEDDGTVLERLRAMGYVD